MSLLPLQRRVTLRRHKYFYIPIEGTPFSLGLALPEGYGMYELLAEQEIRHAKFNGESSTEDGSGLRAYEVKPLSRRVVSH